MAEKRTGRLPMRLERSVGQESWKSGSYLGFPQQNLLGVDQLAYFFGAPCVLPRARVHQYASGEDRGSGR
jgi:hypothetical protein